MAVEIGRIDQAQVTVLPTLNADLAQRRSAWGEGPLRQRDQRRQGGTQILVRVVQRLKIGRRVRVERVTLGPGPVGVEREDRVTPVDEDAEERSGSPRWPRDESSRLRA